MTFLNKINEKIDEILISIEQISKYSNKNQNKNCSIENSFCQLKDNQNEEKLTLENFVFSHLCNRDIRSLPLSKEYLSDIDRLHSCSIFTITDLIGRYLIHRTAKEFQEFLISKVHCSQSFTNEIVFLINQWTFEHIEINRNRILQQYL